MHRDDLAIALLIEIGTRLLAVRDVDDQPNTARRNLERGRRLFSGEQAAPRWQAFLVARPALGPLVDTARRTKLAEQLDDRRAPRLGAGRQKLTGEILAVAVDDEARHCVGLGEYEATRRARIQQPEAAPRFDRARQTAAKELGIDALGGVEAPNARTDLRRGRVGGATQKLAGRADDLDGRAGCRLSLESIDCSGEYPRVPAAQRLLAAGLQPNLRSRALHPAGGLGPPHPARRRPSAAARAPCSTTAPPSGLVRPPPRFKPRPSIMPVSTLAGCAASTSRCAGS